MYRPVGPRAAVGAGGNSTQRSPAAPDRPRLWTERLFPGLEERLKRQDDHPEQQAVGDWEHQRPTGYPGPPPSHAAPYAEREHTGQDDHLDDPRVRDTGDGQHHQDGQRRDRDQQESALFDENGPAFTLGQRTTVSLSPDRQGRHLVRVVTLPVACGVVIVGLANKEDQT
jgi:hypothetical protein